MNNVLAIIVTYNRLDMLKQSVEHILMQKYPCDILIVDNASTDGTGEWAKEYISDPSSSGNMVFEERPAAFGTMKFIYENTGENLGGAGGFNFGMRRAYELGYEYAWIMDDDAFVNETTLSELFAVDEILGGPQNYGYLASTVLFTDGTECKMNRHRIHRQYYMWFDKLQYGIIPVETSTFVSLLLPMGTIKKVGLPIKEYFIWGDDVEYTMRITKMYGMQSYAVGKSIITHAMKQNIGSDISVDEPGRFPNYKRAFRNENHTYREYGIKGFSRYILRCGSYGIKVLKYAKDRKLKRCSIIISQFFAGLFFNPKIEYLESAPKK